MSEWVSSAAPPALDAGGVHVWRVPLIGPPGAEDRLLASLSAAERERAQRRRNPRARGEFIRSRAALRQLLWSYLGAPGDQSPPELELTLGAHGKPALAGGSIEFNLSHSGDWGLVAFSRDRVLGLDVESIEGRENLDRLARRSFSAAELQVYQGLRGADRVAGFFNAWTRKEAFIKAHGVGIGLGLNRFDVSLAPGEPARLLATRVPGDSVDRWLLLELHLGSRHSAALCTERKRRLRLSLARYHWAGWMGG